MKQFYNHDVLIYNKDNQQLWKLHVATNMLWYQPGSQDPDPKKYTGSGSDKKINRLRKTWFNNFETTEWQVYKGKSPNLDFVKA